MLQHHGNGVFRQAFSRRLLRRCNAGDRMVSAHVRRAQTWKKNTIALRILGMSAWVSSCPCFEAPGCHEFRRVWCKPIGGVRILRVILSWSQESRVYPAPNKEAGSSSFLGRTRCSISVAPCELLIRSPLKKKQWSLR